MKNRYLLILMVASVFLVSSCVRDDSEAVSGGVVLEETMPTKILTNDSDSFDGVIRIRLSSAGEAALAPAVTKSGMAITGIPELDQTLSALNVTRIERTFPHNTKFYKRHRKAGLHLWYDVYFDEAKSVSAAVNTVANVLSSHVTHVEPILKPILVDDDSSLTVVQDIIQVASAPGTSALPFRFNDPEYFRQWHYQNDGSNTNWEVGADVNLFRAWEIETGRPEVIVSIVDDGIDFSHSDLKQNLWVNEAELNGKKGVDDDGNGYIDDVHGFNFYTNTAKVVLSQHGTHVAGTVAAVNNNGIGVCGVAGGNGSPDSGVRLIGCQLFQTVSGRQQMGDAAGAIVYSADNGAVICQNSWGLGQGNPLPDAIKEAIDYFTDFAGCDENGVQLPDSPMKGGLVVFSSGNDNSDALHYPGDYERVISVAAMAPNFYKTSYSHFGPTIDITAPGGEMSLYGAVSGVYSTLPKDTYGWMNGTSMACPHVSGIAALVVSKYGVGKPGFTSDKLREIILGAVNDIDSKVQSEYVGQMGFGYIDAFKALTIAEGVAPNGVTDLTSEWAFDGARLTWTVPADQDSGKPARFDILYSKTEFTGTVDFDNPAEGQFKDIAYVGTTAVGSKMSYVVRLKGSEPGEKYYLAMTAVDADGHRSATVANTSGTTVANRPPVIDNLPESIVLKGARQVEYVLDVYDPDWYEWTYVFTPGSEGAKIAKSVDKLTLTFNAAVLTPGNYMAKLVVEDASGLKTEKDIPYKVNENQAPVLANHIPAVVFSNVGEIQNLDLGEYLSDPDGDDLRYDVKVDNASIAIVNNNNGVLKITSKASGTTSVKVVATDPKGASLEVSFAIRFGTSVLGVSPVPVVDVASLSVAGYSGDAEVSVYNTRGSVVLKTTSTFVSGASVLDMSKLGTGNYRIVVRYSNNTISKNITKL